MLGGLFVAAGCSSSSSDGGATKGGGVGAACTADAQCTGYDKPTCNTSLKPIEPYYTGTDPSTTKYRDFTVPFPGGYCGTSLTDSCASDAECGADGGCFIAFEGVSADTINALAQTNLPFDVTAFATLGMCFHPCSSDADCRTGEGYKCIVPLHQFLDVVNPDYKKTYCMQDIDVSALLQ